MSLLQLLQTACQNLGAFPMVYGLD